MTTFCFVFQGNKIDLWLPKGSRYLSAMLPEDKWVLATVALTKNDKVLVHVSGGEAHWLPIDSDRIAPFGMHSMNNANPNLTYREFLMLERQEQRMRRTEKRIEPLGSTIGKKRKIT